MTVPYVLEDGAVLVRESGMKRSSSLASGSGVRERVSATGGASDGREDGTREKKADGAAAGVWTGVALVSKMRIDVCASSGSKSM
jgi:hypothetical protein